MERKGQEIEITESENGAADTDLEQVVAMLDGFAASDAARLKIETSDAYASGEVRKQYHHGRCDIGSPWARGCAFDVLED